MNNILEKEYPELNITEEILKNIKNHPSLYSSAPVKTFMGKIYTTEEFQKRSDEVLAMSLPGSENRVLKRSKWRR